MKTEVIKIGGSILFNSQGKLKKRAIKPLLSLISQMQSKVVLVIGCGENMHQRTLKANLTDKPMIGKNGNEIKMELRVKEAFSLYNDIKQNLIEICKLGGDRFKWTHPAHLFVKKSQGRKTSEINWFDKSPFIGAEGIIVTSGGIVTDRKILFSAISSDTVAGYLASKLNALRLIMLTSTKGVYTSSTSLKTISRIREIDLKDYNIVGGMEDKLRRIRQTRKNDTQVYIASGKIRFAKELLIKNLTDNCTEVLF